MTANNKDRFGIINLGPGLVPLIVIGGLIGFFFAGGLFSNPPAITLACFAWGFALAYLFLQWVEVVSQSITLARLPIPATLVLADREAVRVFLQGFRARNPFTARLRRLLLAWTEGANSNQVIALASLQAAESRPVSLLETMVLFAMILVAGNQLGDNGSMAGAILLLGFTVLGRHQLGARINCYIEERVLAQLPADLAGTTVTAQDLGRILGQAMETSFQKYLPQPGAMGEAVRAAMTDAGKELVQSLKQEQAAVMGAQQAAVKSWGEASQAVVKAWGEVQQGAEKNLTQVQKALADSGKAIPEALTATNEQMQTLLAGHVGQMQEALQAIGKSLPDAFNAANAKLNTLLDEHTRQVQAALQSGGANLQQVLNNKDWTVQLQAILNEHATALRQAHQGSAEQLGRIAGLAATIDQVLKVQQTVETAITKVSSSEEFMATLSALRTHLAESDKLLREAAKPRTIRLVEKPPQA